MSDVFIPKRMKFPKQSDGTHKVRFGASKVGTITEVKNAKGKRTGFRLSLEEALRDLLDDSLQGAETRTLREMRELVATKVSREEYLDIYTSFPIGGLPVED